MKLILLSSSPSGRVAARFKEAARAQDIAFEIVDSSDAESVLDQDMTDTVVLPRISPERNEQSAVLARFQEAGAHVINEHSSWIESRDKWLCYEKFIDADVPTPRSMLAESRDSDHYVEVGEKIIFKPRFGTHGEGIIILQKGDTIPDEPGIIQAFIEQSAGVDIRLVVVGDRVVAAMKRVARPGEFRANLHQGASAEQYIPSETMKTIAIRAAQCLGLSVAGVDMLIAGDQPLVIEANPSPGLGIEKYSGVAVADEIVAAIKRRLI
jgi:ribosomal protein S6--L-glutamate ligase